MGTGAVTWGGVGVEGAPGTTPTASPSQRLDTLTRTGINLSFGPRFCVPRGRNPRSRRRRPSGVIPPGPSFKETLPDRPEVVRQEWKESFRWVPFNYNPLSSSVRSAPGVCGAGRVG